ncbi:hypothetical protein D5041_14790, partial [Verminephrobacter aporrectodeae subsp. tuberculatae]|uniref:SwmB domain-containing protein n=1 Tax=Verminephrobacter aporrectodeae TaxID=1110389 RepID=UPI002238B4CF
MDTTAPQLTSITLDDSALKAGETATVTISFSEAVTGLTAAHLTAPNGTLGALTRSADGLSWTGTLTPAANTTAASNAISVNNLSGVADAAGNPATGSDVSSENYSVDTAAPRLLSIVIADSALKIGETASVTISFSEAVSGFGKANLSVPSGTLSDLSASEGGKVWTGTLTPAENTTAASNAISVNNLSGVADAAGNPATGSDVASGNYAVDTAVPTLSSIAIDDRALKAGATASVTITFSEAVIGFGKTNLNVPHGTLSDLSSSEGGKVWTGTLTPAVNTTAASNAIHVNTLSGTADAAGNPATGSDVTSENYAVDTVRPALRASNAITLSERSLASGKTASVSFHFNTAVQDISAAASASNGALSDWSANADGTVWSATLTPTANVEASTNQVTLDPAHVHSVTGNAGEGTPGQSENYVVDTSVPTFEHATANGRDLVLSYTEASSLGLDETNTAPATAFAVSSSSGLTIRVESATVNALAKTVTLRLNRDVDSIETLNVGYTRPASGNNVLQDAAGNDAANLTSQAVTNNSAADTTAPVLSTATVSGRELVLSYTEASSLGLDAAHTLPATAFAVSSASGVAIAVENVTVSATAKTVTLHLSRDVDSTEAVSVGYTRPASGNVLQDAAGNAAANLIAQTVSNSTAADTTAPVLDTATVNGNDLVLTYTEASSLGLDAVHTAPATAFAVSSGSGLAISVERAAVDATAKTVTLRLSRAVDHGETVNLSYTRPASGNEVLQDAAGNAADSIIHQVVSNNSAADTTAPVIHSITVTGRDLVLSYTEASSLGLDATHTAPITAFAVSSSSGVAIGVESAAVDATAKTVTLRLSRTVDSSETVDVNYTRPAAGPDVIQDAAGNDADNLTHQATTNQSPADTTAPVISGATVSGRELVLSYTEASGLGLDAAHTALATAFAVSSASGVAISVDNVTVDATGKSITLHLSRDVDNGEVVRVNYTKPTTGNVLQDAAGNDADNLTNQAVTNQSAADTTAPVLSTATVNANTLVLTYTEASSLGLDAINTAPATAFAVSSTSGLAIAVDSTTVDATAKTVTLHLSRAVDHGEVVNVSYTRPAGGNGVLQDAAGNDAANLTNQAVTNSSAADTTAPVFSTATVSGRDLVLAYTEVSSLGLDATHTPPSTAFAVSSASGIAIAVESVAIHATAKTVTLHLSRDVDSTEVVSLGYTKPASGNVLQDAAGNDAANFTDQAVTNNSGADTTAPVLSSATVSERNLVLTYTEASSLGLDAVHTAPATAYAVSSASGVAISVENVTVNPTAKTVTLLLNRDVDSTEVVRLGYTRAATNNDVLQDAAGNDAANLTDQAVTNNSGADTTAPVLSSATVSDRDLVLTYTEASSLGLDAVHTAPSTAYAVSSTSGLAIAVESVTVNPTAKTVTLRLSRSVDSGEVVTLNYTRPASGPDVLQDAAGNDAENLINRAVTNNSAADTTVPVLSTATVSGRNLVLTYTEASSLGLDATNTAPTTAFAVSSASGVAITVDSLTVDPTAKTVTLLLSRAVDSGEAVILNYTRPASGNQVLQDAAGNDAANLTNEVVTNNSAADTTAPVLGSATVSGRELVLTYTEASSLGLDATHTAPVTAYAVSSASGVVISVENVTVNPTAKTVTLLLSRDVDSTEAVSLGYTKPAGDNVLQDAAGNDAANLRDQAVTNNSGADTTAPVLGSATVSDRDLVLTYTEASSLGLDAAHTAPSTAFAVSSTSGLAIAVESVTVNPTAKTVTLRLSRSVDSSEVVTLNYTRPASGPDVLQDAAGNDAENLINRAVTNNSAADTTAPVLSTATVSGRNLVLTYTEASSLGLDATNTAPTAAFAVSSASGVAITVENVTVNPTAKTVTLLLSRDVDSTEAVSLGYTKPAGDNVLQDAAGNDAANLRDLAVTNNSGADTTAPVLNTATVSGHDLVLTYTEASSLGLDATHTAPATAYAVSSASGVAIAVNSVTVHATAKTVTLRLSRSVDSGEAVSLSYTRPAAGPDVLQDAAGNDVENLTNRAVTNNSAADTTAPVLSAAAVNGHFLALSYTEASSLGLDETHTAPPTAFAVSSASGLAIAVDSVTVNALAKTVTLRLSRDVDSGEAVTVSYTRPAAGPDVLQDAAGNDAANLTNEVVKNNSAADTTAPVLGSATVSGRELVLAYTEVSSLGLGATHTVPATAFAVSSASGLAITVENVTVHATAKTVTLHLSRDVDSTEVLSLNYTRPASGNNVLQDAAGNAAANLTNQAVSNGSAADTTAPVLSSATVSGHDLVLTYTETSSLGLDAVHTAPATAFAVNSASGVAITVDSVTVNATAKTVTLRLNRAVDSSEALSLGYTRPATGNDVLQDAAGNDAANLTNQAVTNNSAADTTAPVLSTATVSGRDLVLTYTDASSLGLDATHTAPAAAFALSSASGVAISAESVTVDATAKTVTLRLSRSVDSGEAVTLGYTKPASGNNVLQDATGNDADSFTSQAVTNNSAADTTAPVLDSAAVSGRELVLSYTEVSSLGLDATHTASATAFAVSSASGVAIAVENVTVNATAKTLTLHLNRDVDSTEAITLGYTRPTADPDVLQDAAGNDAANLTNQAVTNHSAPDTTAPVLRSTTVSGRDLV